MGDAAGIGPEVILKSLNDKEIYNLSSPVVIGDFFTLNKVKEILLDKGLIRDLSLTYPNVLIYDDFNLNLKNIKIGRVSKECGKASILFLKKVVELINKKVVNGTVSAPVSKEAVNLAGYSYKGQTEFFTEITNANKVVPLIIIGNVRIFQLTAHISLREVLLLLTKERVLEVIRFSNDSLKRIGIKKPKVSIAGLNPHAGENGLLGTEEIEIIKPAVREARKEGIDIYGPYPVDSLFIRVRDGEFDCIITIYHDQATIAMKLLGTPVTMTLGLPFIRTSVGHGTAFDIAGKGIADEHVFRKSIITCVRAVKK
jgi:4-hydroxythreonine-4-phosphate dehydrogenase